MAVFRLSDWLERDVLNVGDFNRIAAKCNVRCAGSPLYSNFTCAKGLLALYATDEV